MITLLNDEVMSEDLSGQQTLVELLHFPREDSRVSVELSDIVDWCYEHKDEMFMNPSNIPELNMGKRLYKHIVEGFKKYK